jgi:hypothetical protein
MNKAIILPGKIGIKFVVLRQLTALLIWNGDVNKVYKLSEKCCKAPLFVLLRGV